MIIYIFASLLIIAFYRAFVDKRLIVGKECVSNSYERERRN